MTWDHFVTLASEKQWENGRDMNSLMVGLAPRGAKPTIGELISENFQNHDLVLLA